MQLRIGSLLFAGAMASRIHSVDTSVDAVGDLVAEDADADLFSSAELSVDEALRSLDQDGDGSISKAEFQAHVDVQEITEYLAWVQEHAGEAWPAEPEARFEFLDEDGSGHLDPHEQERATSMAEAAVLISRQATQSNGSSLEGTMAKKVKDPRCESAGEGFKCLTDKSMIYCTAKKRMGNEETCGWEGKCKRGILGSGGCDYPLCKGKVNGLHCATHRGSNVVVKCNMRWAHGRFERESSLVESCHGGCQSFPDGPPPSRRRRTCNGGRVCTFGDCDTYALMESQANVTSSAHEEADEEAASMQWTVDGCARVQPENRNKDKQLSKWDTAAVRCCSYHAQKCESTLVGCKRQTYQAAKQTCAAHGMRLCSWHEMKTNLCCGTGCNFDLELAWVLGGSYAKKPVDFDPNGHSPVHAPRRRYTPAYTPRRRYTPAHSHGCYKTPDPQDPPFARCR